MTDIIERLRHWSHGLTYDPAVGLMHEAAAEIDRLRNGAAESRETVTLTDEEREAVGVAIQCLMAAESQRHPEEERDRILLSRTHATLRKLLERLK